MSSSAGDYGESYQRSDERNELAPSGEKSENAAYGWPSEMLNACTDFSAPQSLYQLNAQTPPPFAPFAPSPLSRPASQSAPTQQRSEGTPLQAETARKHGSSLRAHTSTFHSTLSSAAPSLGSGELSSSPFPHRHSDTYERPLPPEALGARQLVDYIFTPHSPGRPHSSLSPPSVVPRPSPREIGWPMPLLAEPVNPSSGRRLVFFGKGQQPQFVLGEKKNRFIAVTFKPILSVAAAAVVSAAPELGDTSTTTGYASYGTVLGYSDDNTKIVWHDRSERFASYVSLSSIQSIHRASAMQCRHCGFVLLKQELREHMNTHKKGSGVEYGVFTDDESLGMLCGDSGLMQNLASPRRLGEGAQGVVDLMEVVQPTMEEVAQAGPSSAAYRFVSEHLSHESRLQKVVLKSMHFGSEAKALDEYQKSVRFMTVMQHPHLVEYLAVQLKPDRRTVCICMPYYQEGDVGAMIRSFRGGHFDESFVCSVALQLSLALAFLHERNPPIVHGDLKVENAMFYNNKQQIVLTDLDASREVLGGYQEAVQSSLGTTAYMAPETLKVERLMPSSDMWSLGVFLYVLTVLPDFPMILNPNTQNLDLLNADCWATEEDLRAMESYSSALNDGHSNAPSVNAGSGNCGITLGECVRANITRKGYSRDLAQLVVDLLSYNPLKRPTAEVVGCRLTEIMTDYLLEF
ncbi:protein kinase, putative [Leishmania donovani]|uniref:Protein kinase domain family protein n=1 Tax=Leishmania donovani TaxID=5661 RepID=A0A3S5H6X9_LEIDO|nr:protein kinase, putative [Leishmania donovani]AYU77669.1 protein kinase, putative [Leishmania donovani]TPP51154.1 Protein kinase domain family protein [Leishmania donovani]CBZ33066.1 protein kinase, putative [Leishmania donovani]